MSAPIESYLQSIPACGCGGAHELVTKQVRIGTGVLAQAASIVSGRTLLIADKNMHAYAERALSLFPAAQRSVTEILVLPGEVHADEHSLAVIIDGMTRSSCVFAVAVGSGTINDLVKVAAHTCGIPYACIATAASMDGYLSANATILTGGNKVAYSNIRPPTALIADIDIIRTAPERMALAGLGDAFGKITSLADWKLNNIIIGERYCGATASMLRDEVSDLLTYLPSARSLSDDDALRRLMRILVLTGIAMQRMGNSAPASGGEHCISHAMEMRGYALRKEAPSLHGLQVAYGLNRSFAAYKDIFEAAGVQAFAADTAGMLRAHSEDWRSIGIDLSATIEKKIAMYDAKRSAFSSLRGHNDDDDFRFMLSSADAVRTLAERFRLPASPAGVGLSREDAAFAVMHAVDIRPRFSIFDMHCAQGTLSDYTPK